MPDYRDGCPLCRGVGCPVRHGLYFRRVVDEQGGIYERFPVVRFCCRRRGPNIPKDRTFSVLPAALVPRRRFALALMVSLISCLCRYTVRAALDWLAGLPADVEGDCCIEEARLYSLLELFSRVYMRLLAFPLPARRVEIGLTRPRLQSLEVIRLLQAQARASPISLVMRFHRHYFPALLFDVRVTAANR